MIFEFFAFLIWNEQQESTIYEMKEESLCFVLDHESKIIETHVAFEKGLIFKLSIGKVRV